MLRRPPPSRPRWLALGLAAVLASLAAALVTPGAAQALGYLLPVLLLLACLGLKRYPGQRLLIGLADRRRSARRRTLAACRPRTSPPRALLPRGGRLLAAALAVRPPPAAVSALS
jgi:hypothetical protein